MVPPVISKRQALEALATAGKAREAAGGDGVAGLSMDELAAAAGVSRATLYRLFGSQGALLRELGMVSPPTVRSRILDVALELVGRDGLAELSMDELAAAAEVSRATLYRLFPGKAALFGELVRVFSPFEAIAAVLETMRDRPPAEVIPAIARAMAGAMDGHLGLLLQLLFAFSRGLDEDDGGLGPGRGAGKGMRTLPLVAGYLAEQMDAGRLRRMDPALAFEALVGPIVMHLCIRPAIGSVHGRQVPLDEAVEQFAVAWLRAMASDQQASPERAAPVSSRASPKSRRDHDGRTDATPGTGRAR